MKKAEWKVGFHTKFAKHINNLLPNRNNVQLFCSSIEGHKGYLRLFRQAYLCPGKICDQSSAQYMMTSQAKALRWDYLLPKVVLYCLSYFMIKIYVAVSVGENFASKTTPKGY